MLFLYLWTGLSSSILSTAFLRWKYISFLNFQKLWAASLSLWFVVGVHYLSPCRWWRLFLSRRMAAASVFQTLLSGNPLNWIFTRLMFPVCAGAPQAPFSPRRTDLSLHKPDLSENNTKIDYAFRGNEWTAKPWMSTKRMFWKLCKPLSFYIIVSAKEMEQEECSVFLSQLIHEAPPLKTDQSDCSNCCYPPYNLTRILKE